MVSDWDVSEEEAEGVPAVEGNVDALHAQLVPKGGQFNRHLGLRVELGDKF